MAHPAPPLPTEYKAYGVGPIVAPAMLVPSSTIVGDDLISNLACDRWYAGRGGQQNNRGCEDRGCGHSRGSAPPSYFAGDRRDPSARPSC